MINSIRLFSTGGSSGHSIRSYNNKDNKLNVIRCPGHNNKICVVVDNKNEVHQIVNKKLKNENKSYKKLKFYKKKLNNWKRLKYSPIQSSKNITNYDESSFTSLNNINENNLLNKDDNLIRINVPYNCEPDHIQENLNEIGDNNICVSEIFVDYNPKYLNDEKYYNENAIDCPEDFIANHLENTKDKNYKNQKERWPINKFKNTTQKSFPSFIQANSKKILISNHEMGTSCSIKLKNHVYPISEVSSNFQVNSRRKNKISKSDKISKSFQDEQYFVPANEEFTYNLSGTNSSCIRNSLSNESNKTDPIKYNQPSIDIFTSDDKQQTGSIEWDNILHRRNGAYEKSKIEIPASRNCISHNNSMKTSTLLSVSERTSAKFNKNNERYSCPADDRQSYLKRFSGSVQNLVNFNKLDKQKSLSENNLSNNNIKKENNKCEYVSSSNIDYCPSVLYNRKQVANSKVSTESKSFTLKKLKKIFTGNLPKMKRLSKQETIQDVDGGFFEKFGSLLRQKSEMDESHLSTPLAPLNIESNEEIDEISITNVSNRMTLTAIPEGEQDSGTESLHESDSEPDESRAKHESFIEDAVGMNIDELYEEILHEILHNIGCESSEEVCQPALIEYVQEAFKITNEKHEEILKSAETKEAAEIRLNVEIIKAEGLVPKDSNGLSDPFVTMFLESCSTHRYNTSVKSATLNPLWEEHFSLPLPDENPNNEVLVLEIWDFDAAETVGEKMNKFFEVKGIRGLRKLMKEIAVTASTGKHDNELIGRTAIPLKTIPASGIKVWHSLEKGSRTSKTRGSVLLYMSFSAEKNNRVAAQEHRHLLRILLMHELESSKVAHYWWRGKFSAQGEAVLTQHSAQSGLTPIDCAMAQWSVYANTQQDHPLAFGLFNSILDKIIPTLQSLPNDDDEIKLFWEGAKRLLPSCFSIIRKLRKKTAGDKHCVKMLTEALDIISKVAMLEPPEGTDLLPKSIYGWIVRDDYDDNTPNWDLKGALRDAVNSGALDWFEHINENSECQRNGTEEERLQHLIKLIQLVRSDLQKAVEYYDRHFQQKMHFNYAQSLFLFYEKKLAEYSQPVVEDVCRNIKRLSISEDKFERLPEHEEINMGTTLFELYLVLKRFITLGIALCPGEEDLAINKYHEWFTPGVTHWLDISVYKALTRIEKAIDLDRLIPVDETVKYSSSAVDTLAIFYQIKIFWQQLGWPDIEGAYMFVGKIVDDICRCCVFYADRMSKRVEELNLNDVQERFEVTREWCLAINNIDYIRQSLTPFIKELGADEIIAKLAEYRSEIEAERCAATIKNVLENAIDTERNKILELIEVVAQKMSPAMRRFLTEGAEVLQDDSNSMDRLMMYLENSLQTLHTELNEVNFERTLDAIWSELAIILYELVQSNLDKRRPPAFFSNLRDTLHLMVTSFKLTKNSNQNPSDQEILENIERLLELHAYETGDLIHQYYLTRLEDQKNMSHFVYGQLTVRGYFADNILHMEIMNARNLVPMDSNGSCDSFVKIHFMPAEKFLGISPPKTSVQHKTLFPLYDEKFKIILSEDQRKMDSALLVFSIKDKDLFGMSNQYIAECYLSFNDIKISENEQIHMTLTRPEYKEGVDSLRALEYRQGDKQAREFIKKLKQKAY